jgi:AbrB family looped-hinge helix DNA binding protein
METTTLSTKGQIVLPKDLRTSRGWGPGTRFRIEATTEGVLLRPARPFPRTTLDQVAGCLKPKRKLRLRTDSQMHAAIAREVKRRHDLGRY